MGIASVISLIITLLPGILGEAGVITPSIQKLIAQLGAAIPGLITSLAQGKGPTDDVMTVLQAFRAEIGTLTASGAMSAEQLQLAASLDTALEDALQGYNAAQTVTDPSTLTALPETL